MEIEFAVYSLHDRVWRVVVKPSCLIGLSAWALRTALPTCLYFQGAIYWKLSKFPGGRKKETKILCFEVDAENFSFLELPSIGDKDNMMMLKFIFLLGGSLAVFGISPLKRCIWVLEKDQSWRQEFSGNSTSHDDDDDDAYGLFMSLEDSSAGRNLLYNESNGTFLISFSLDKWTGKKCYMLGARELTLAFSDNSRCWRWKPLPESRFPEVAELLGVAELHITGRISTQLLSPNTTYHMYFSFMLGAWSRGFEVSPVKVFVSRIATNGAYLGGSSSYDTSKSFYLKAPENDEMFDDVEGEEAFEHRRDSGHRWIKIDMGKYFNRVDDNVAALEMTLMGTEVSLHKSGLIIHGIEILPLD
ncbi:hypothetical protein SOVF_131400 [Spinacia oleracea]|nr:hypothetical protein SOVF_131400 [Spinacia oleracea]